MKTNPTVLANMNTTAVDEKDLPMEPQVTYTNVPADIDAAIQRILKLEMSLEDMSRAFEIVGVTGQLSILDSFKIAAELVLESKIQIVQPDMNEDFKLTVITNEKEEGTDAKTK